MRRGDDLGGDMTACRNFGVGVTVSNDRLCLFLSCGEGDYPTHFVLIEPEDFGSFATGILSVLNEATMLNNELADLEGTARERRIQDILSRYQADMN